jgi:hypothetical protein
MEKKVKRFALFERWGHEGKDYVWHECEIFSAGRFATRIEAEGAKKLQKPEHHDGIISAREIVSEGEGMRKRKAKKKKLPRLRLGERRGRR